MTMEVPEILTCDPPLTHQVGGDSVHQASTLHILHENPWLVVKGRVSGIDDIRVPCFALGACASHENWAGKDQAMCAHVRRLPSNMGSALYFGPEQGGAKPQSCAIANQDLRGDRQQRMNLIHPHPNMHPLRHYPQEPTCHHPTRQNLTVKAPWVFGSWGSVPGLSVE